MAPRSGRPDTPHSEPRPDTDTQHWTTHTVWLVLGLVVLCFAFVVVLVSIGVDLRVATAVAASLLIVIVTLVLPTRRGGTLARRFGRALRAFLQDGEGPR